MPRYYSVRGLSPKFIYQACKIIVRQNETVFVYGHVGKAFNINCV